MVPKAIVGRGVSGAVRYVFGEGRDRATGHLKDLPEGQESRVAWFGGQGFGWAIESREDADLARRIMEHAADPKVQASKTKPCEKDCLHLVLSWRTGEEPSREEMEAAAAGALGVLGMGKARALFVAHRDEKHAHLHIIASKIDPETGRAFDLFGDRLKLSKWAYQWEREHGGIQCERRGEGQLAEAIREHDSAAILELMTQRRATFTGADIDRELRRILPEAEADRLKAAMLVHPEVLRLYDRDSGAALDRFTTAAVREAETKALEDGQALAGARRHAISGEAERQTLERFATLRPEQRDAFRHATGKEGLALIDGKAGTGKSFTMAAIRTAYEHDHCRVIGLAPTNAVAEDMRADGFKEGRTIHSALFALKNGRDSWNAKTCLMVDEAAMIDTRLMGELLAQARHAGAKVILVGDERQLASIERGGLFAALRERVGAASLNQVTRQQDDRHKEAAEMLAAGRFGEAVAVFEDAGCIERSDHLEDAKAALLARWQADSAAASDKTRMVFAYTNDDVKDFNAAIRAVRRERGELGAEREFTTTDGKAGFADGDRLIFTTTDNRRGITNGATGTIEKIEGSLITLRLDGKTPKALTFDAVEANGFRHGYAATVYKGQGRTFDQTYLFHSHHWRDAASYVALTRHRENVTLFVATEVAHDNAALARQMGRRDDRRASLAFDTEAEARQRHGAGFEQTPAAVPRDAPARPVPEAAAPAPSQRTSNRARVTSDLEAWLEQEQARERGGGRER